MVEERSLEEMARALVESGEYRIVRQFMPRSAYHPPDDTTPVLLGAVVDVETTGTSPERDRIIELGVSLFEFSRDGRIFRVIGSYEWFEDPGIPIPPEVVKLREHVLGERRPVWPLRITARERYSDRRWDWGRPASDGGALA